ncbi:hypothetical protein H6F32_05260 [Anabaena sp. FACHB-1237]|uniref:hypothetical protein n=1 Tax=Anabaena sp. FACHB-1237 TaxID=2692769 RepID=UPI0016819F87|nr:hypothetical protein [Anabaena sp. FACHB-1237]MBD2137007.1 hypothetical protein [Anabaena sp. FACHB-1237]
MTYEEKISRHAATDRDKCQEMADKYGWQLLKVEPTNNKILKVDCIFAGETEFLNYDEESENE